VIPRSLVSIGVDVRLRPSLAERAAGRALVIDYFASRRCGVVVGDLTAGFVGQPPAARNYAELASIEGVPVFAHRLLLSLLRDAQPGLIEAGPVFARHLAVRLEQPERWLDFLEQPGAIAGKRGVTLW
jgi:hypothetical protein